MQVRRSRFEAELAGLNTRESNHANKRVWSSLHYYCESNWQLQMLGGFGCQSSNQSAHCKTFLWQLGRQFWNAQCLIHGKRSPGDALGRHEGILLHPNATVKLHCKNLRAWLQWSACN
jgi:hypothetical protein